MRTFKKVCMNKKKIKDIRLKMNKTSQMIKIKIA